MTQPLPEYDGCDWPIDPACRTDDWDALDDDVKARAVHLASATLTRLTGYRVGGCPLTVRPCQRRCAGSALPAYWDMQSIYGYGYGAFWPTNYSGVWVNSCGCTTDCSCVTVCEVTLPPPVGGVTSVRVDGTDIPPEDYLLYGNRLTWAGAGDCPWPVCQDLTLPDTEVGTFSVTYLNSYPVDALGAYAAGVMAIEFARACTGNNKCRLPSTVTTVARQGISMEMPNGAFPDGRTGIREVDSYLAMWNPTPIRQAPSVWSPDLPSPRVQR